MSGQRQPVTSGPVTTGDVEALLAELATIARDEPCPCVDDLVEGCAGDWEPGTGPRRKDTKSIRRAKQRRTATQGLGRLARCAATGKVQYRDHEEAVKALHHAKAARDRAEADGASTTLFAVRTYECDECPFWHVTKIADAHLVAIETHAREDALSDRRRAAIRSLAAASGLDGHDTGTDPHPQSA